MRKSSGDIPESEFTFFESFPEGSSPVSAYEERNGRKVVNLSDGAPARPELTKRQAKRQERAWGNLRSQGTAIRGRLAGADYATAKHAEQIMSGAFGKRGKRFESTLDDFTRQHGMHPSTAVSRFMEHGHLGTPSSLETRSGERWMPSSVEDLGR